MAYINRGIQNNRASGNDNAIGKIIAGEHIRDALLVAIEEIEEIRLKDINCDADGMRDRILEILKGKQSNSS